MSDDPFSAVPNPTPVKIRKKKKKKKKLKNQTGKGATPATTPQTSIASGGTRFQASASSLITACAIQLYEHNGLEEHLMGVKGAAIVGLTKDNKFHILIYESDSKRQVLVVTVNHLFQYEVQSPPPDRQNTWMASFTDDSGNYWSIQFSSSKDSDNFARHIALVKHYMAVSVSNSLSPPTVRQDLSVGQPSTQSVQTGDHVKVKYAVFELSTNHPKGMGRRIAAVGLDSPKVYHLGSGKIGRDIERGVVGMKKDGRRLLVLPPQQQTETQHWNTDSSLPIVVEIAVVDAKFADRSASLYDQAAIPQQVLPQQVLPQQAVSSTQIHSQAQTQPQQKLTTEQQAQQNLASQATRRVIAQQFGPEDAISSQVQHNPHYEAQQHRLALQQAHESQYQPAPSQSQTQDSAEHSTNGAQAQGSEHEFSEEEPETKAPEPVSITERMKRLASRSHPGGVQLDPSLLFGAGGAGGGGGGGGGGGSAKKATKQRKVSTDSSSSKSSDKQQSQQAETSGADDRGKRRHSIKKSSKHHKPDQGDEQSDNNAFSGMENLPETFSRQESAPISTAPIKHLGLRHVRKNRRNEVDEANEKSGPFVEPVPETRGRQKSYEDIRGIFEQRKSDHPPQSQRKSSSSPEASEVDVEEDLPDLETRASFQASRSPNSPAVTVTKSSASPKPTRGSRGRGTRGRGTRARLKHRGGSTRGGGHHGDSTHNDTHSTPKQTSSQSMEDLLVRIGLEEYVTAFEHEHIALKDALLLPAADLKHLVPRMGPRTRLVNELEDLRQEGSTSSRLASTSPHSSSAPHSSSSPRSPMDELQHEYLRGKEEGRKEATSTQEEIHNSRTRINMLENELEKLQTTHEQSTKQLVQAAKVKIAELHEQINRLTKERDVAIIEKDDVVQRGREFVTRLKNDVANKQRDTEVQCTRDAMTELYLNLKNRIHANELYNSTATYNGEEFLSLTKEAIKESTSSITQKLKRKNTF